MIEVKVTQKMIEVKVTLLMGVVIENKNKVYNLHDEETFEALKPFVEGHKNVDYTCIFSEDYSKIYFGVVIGSKYASDVDGFEVLEVDNTGLEEKLNSIFYVIFEKFNKLFSNFEHANDLAYDTEYGKTKIVKKGMYQIFENV